MEEVIILKGLDPCEVFHIQQAAIIEGMTVEDFIIKAALAKADEIVDEKVRGK